MVARRQFMSDDILLEAQANVIDALLEGLAPQDFSSRCTLLINDFKFIDHKAASEYINKKLKERHGNNVLTFTPKSD
jgi:hypothetical protein|tara:strand:- start:58 stop:288 length:231 start_codon:yes stop_codon:yes gene_type:complete